MFIRCEEQVNRHQSKCYQHSFTNLLTNLSSENMPEKHLERLLSRFSELTHLKGQIMTAYEMIKKCYSEGNTLFICGNGGSAADSEHLVAELMKGFLLPRKITDTKLISKLESLYADEGRTLISSLQNGLRTISLMSHPSLHSAFSNDVNPEMVFAQQLFVLAKPGDILIGISTSGNSKNVRRAMQLANVIGVNNILLTGMNKGKCETTDTIY